MTASPSLLRAQLRCHPATPAGLPLSLSVEVRTRSDGLRLQYSLKGDIARVRMPAPAAPVPADRLWEHTCLEAFVAADGAPAYQEFNFSPSSEWAAFRFSDQRQRDAAAEALHRILMTPPQVKAGPRIFSLTARLPLSALPRSPVVLSLGLSAVIEELDGRRSYWALHHPLERPDFHHREGHTLRLSAPLS